MDLSPKGIITPLQGEVLAGFFRRTQGFFLTGGTALAEFYLGHRDSQDLDLFCLDDADFADAPAHLAATAAEAGATLTSLRTAPTYRNYGLEKDGERFLVDLVRDTAFQVVPDKPSWKGVRVDAVEDIVSNKLCTVLSRSELKDYIDLYFLAKAGISLDAALPHALQKDGGISKTMLAYLMSEMRVRQMPGYLRVPLTAGELQGFFKALSERWAAESMPR